MDLSFVCLFMLVLVNRGVGLDECEESRCGRHGPVIRFPFRLKDKQPDHCGYPGFDLSCKKHHTLLELPTSVKLYVSEIDYAAQLILTSDPDNCLPRQVLNFNLSASPFRFRDESQYSYVFFNCSSIDRNLQLQMPCLSGLGYNIFAFTSDYPISQVNLAYCTKMFSISSVAEQMIGPSNFLHLNWSQPKCRVCETQNKYCRLKRSSNHSTTPLTECFDKPKPKPDTKGTKRKLLATGITLGSLLLALVVFAIYRIYSSHKEEEEHQARIENFLQDYRALKPSRYSYADIKRITNQFMEKLGVGAYGTVFEGKLSDEIFVAVKILNNSTGNGEEFINEVGTMGRIHHVNVVRLIGYCADGFRRALVYEYLPNESLENFVSRDHLKNLPLSWEKLQDIALGIAKGIEYLHQGCDHRILHFDIKPHNILLDNNFNPKLSDFGLAKLCPKDQSAVSMTTARGTMGYIAPEVFSRNFGNASYKSDVYSFGMVLLGMGIQAFRSRRRVENPNQGRGRCRNCQETYNCRTMVHSVAPC